MYTYNPILLPIYPRSLCHFPIIALHHLYLQYNNTTTTTHTFTYRYIVPSRRHLLQHSTSLYDLSLCPCLYSEGNFHCAPVSTQKAISIVMQCSQFISTSQYHSIFQSFLQHITIPPSNFPKSQPLITFSYLYKLSMSLLERYAYMPFTIVPDQ